MDPVTTAPLSRSHEARSIAARLAEARTRLIETGTRNRLVHTNRKCQRPSTLAILYPDVEALFARLVRQTGALRFRSDPRVTEGGEKVDESAEAITPTAADAPADVLQTRVSEETLQKRLLKLFRDTKTLEEEQGVNILFLALGFLRWFEDDKSEVLREAPLILVPVTLVRDLRRSTFDLRVREDEISTNLPLAERLRNDFGVVLPPIPEDDEWTPLRYFDAVADAVQKQRRWTIDRSGVELGLFSFAKLLMFNDLQGEAWPSAAILEHPLLRGLLVSGFEAEAPLFPEDTKIDETFEPADLVHVVDADGSQTLAIETVRAGRNLVIQGPPGTGKSQTITNIIASAVHDGKTVLFVAEKMVALEVVHARLRQAGIGAACLELHSRAANKRSVAEELGRTLQSGAAEPNLARDNERLKAVRDRLNGLSHRLHTPVGNTGMTPFRVLGQLAQASGRGLPPPQLSLPEIHEWDSATYEKAEGLTARLGSLTTKSGRLEAHPWRGVRRLSLQPLDLERLTEPLLALESRLAELTKLLSLGATTLEQPLPGSFKATRALLELFDLVRAAPVSSADAVRRLAGLRTADESTAREIIREGKALQDALKAAEAIFAPAAMSAETVSVRSDLARAASSWLARLFPRYRRASAELATWLKEPLPKRAPERIALVDTLEGLKAQQKAFAEHELEGALLLGPLWRGSRTDFDGLLSAADWLKEVRAAGAADLISRALNLAEHGDLAERFVEKLSAEVRAAKAELSSVATSLDLDWTAAFGASAEEAGLAAIAERVRGWVDAKARYMEWVDLARTDAEIRCIGAADIADRLSVGDLAPEVAVAELKHARAEAVWKAAIAHDPEIARPHGEERSALVAEFKRLDVERRHAVAGLIRARHSTAMPRGAMGEMAIVRGEVARKRGHLPIRKLIQRAGRTVQAIKPVFMMSPISVAQYLPPGSVAFDLVVIDEASQVRPEDALGVIARAKQVVVVGDRKQLPPTSFFSRLLADEAGDDEDADEVASTALSGAARVTELESILTLCEARGLPARMLRWHYRSRHPSLIEVSNAQFYGSNLFLPPAPSAARNTEGLMLRQVAGAYDRGGKRTNAIEAQAIVDAVAKHASESPGLTLGIVTFSTPQRDVVSNLLDERRRSDPILDGFLRPGAEEVFVKNLENVQGDERDVILISIGYGPRQPGAKLDSMSFGPVSSEGGERRLNVLFTRARHRCEVFSSFDAGDIDLGRATGEGPRVLKRFLAYAETGTLDLPDAGPADYDSPFEEDVAQVIRSLGYLTDPQVGSAGFRIDLGIRRPDDPGRYILAVECDGATYHGALWARERDRLRQEVLEGLGWRFHRIWSTDWFYRRQAEIDRLKRALEASWSQVLPTAVVSRPSEPNSAQSITVESSGPDPQPWTAPAYKVADFTVRNSLEPHEAPVSTMAEIVGRIVAEEGPIHADEVGRRVAALYGKERAGARIAAAASRALLHHRQRTSGVHEEDGFWFTERQQADCPIRNRSEGPITVQRADMIPPLEIRAAVRRALCENGGVHESEIAVAVARLLGFLRTGQELRSKIDHQVSLMIEDGALLENAGYLRASSPVLLEA